MLLSACSNQQSVLYVPTKEVDVQSMELRDVQRWPERIVTMMGRMVPCPESSADVSHALDDFEEALGTTTTLLERGNVKDAILEEWQEQMSGLYDESTTAQWGNLAGADGVAMLEITCRNGIQVHAVTVSDAETGQRLFSEQYVGGNVASAMNLFAMELAARDRIVRHPLDGVPEQVLRDSTFSYFEVDELGAATWRTEMEAVMQRSLSRYRPSNRMNLNAPVEVDLDLDPLRGATRGLPRLGTALGNGRAALPGRGVGHGPARGADVCRGPAARHGRSDVAVPVLTTTRAFPMRVRMEGAEGPQEVRDALRGAPPGNYEFQYRFWRLGANKQSKETQSDFGPAAEHWAVPWPLSAMWPQAWGWSRVTFGQKKGGNWLLVAVALACRIGGTRIGRAIGPGLRGLPELP